MKVLGVILGLLVLAVVGAVIADKMVGPEVVLPEAQRIDPPAGAFVMDREVTPELLWQSVIPYWDEPAAANAALANQWLPESGWRLAVSEVKVHGTTTRVSCEVVHPTTQGFCFLILSIPGDPGPLREGDVIRFTGRVQEVFMRGGILTNPVRIEITDASIISRG